MARIQELAIIGVVVALSCGAWLHEHDKRVRWEGEAKARSAELTKRVKELEGFRKAVEVLDSGYAASNRKYERRKGIDTKTIDSLQLIIDTTSHEIVMLAPGSLKPKIERLANACQRQREVLTGLLTTCDSLKKEIGNISTKKDKIIQQAYSQRDEYKQLFNQSQSHRPSEFWSAAGKLETGVGLLAVVTKFLGLW